ncbi:MAG TPA: hypothetical protein VLK65_29955 [Vicinamibacteria bacterium]|nr:hypothetical protein [Vicinamibacteria bacterium]HXV59750.1 hypothetical protein [Vicinamibacteria bacterium]
MAATLKKKTYNLDAQIIERVRRLLHAKTETEAIQKALQKTIDDSEIEEALEKMLAEGRFRPTYR